MATTITAPTTAERIRSACAKAGGAMLAVEGCENGQPTEAPVHHLLGDGSFAITVPLDSAAAAKAVSSGTGGVQAVLEMTDYAPLPLREPVRSLVWIRGRLHGVAAGEVPALLDLIASEDPNPALLQVNSASSDGDRGHTLLRLEIDSVVVADSTGAEAVGVSTLLGARPDPFCAMESCWLQHMESAHREVVERLASRLPMSLRHGRVRPLGLDRYGVQLRVETDEGDHDVRLPFYKPVDDVTGLSQAIRVLMGCPFLNGLRARKL
ncbi:DUF2470 domain-containing protein [Mycolicibacterium sp. ND9-15]|uniref:DUF2470 domain-containing protein n=1 Tax=Mycolicibacterium sp. ND9-15 TaxID=3042320 RepID=UPI002DD809B1|nr:DUF2470 domain-containing protein [Mycolicibacterium sp. ND9-15]WSE54387.1 DUF2470 domain-containing protein [Mycolicibacterium sp. ND9-15]